MSVSALLHLFLASVTAVVGLIVIAFVVVLGLPFWVVAGLTRLGHRWFVPRAEAWPSLIEFDTKLGWRPKASQRVYHLADDVFQVTTDADGWRGLTTLVESHIVVFGDSFAWGFGVDDTAFFAHLTPQLRVKTIGTIGYNMVQELLCMQELAPYLSGKLVVWFVYFGNDLYDNVTPHMYGYRAPFVREVNGMWEIVTDHLSAAKWPLAWGPDAGGGRLYYTKLAELCSPTYFAERAYAACAYLIRQGRDICLEAGAQLVVLTIPDQNQLSHDGVQFLLSHGGDSALFDPDFPDQQISDICQELDVPFFAAKQHLTPHHYKKHDSHWNQAGHKKIAGILATLYREHGPHEHSLYSL